VHTLAASIGFGCYFQTGPRAYHLAGPDDWVLNHQLNRIDRVVDAVRRCPNARLVERRGDLDPRPNDNRVSVVVHLTGNAHTVDLGTVDQMSADASEASARAIIETSSKPVIDSHTTSRALVPLSRDLHARGPSSSRTAATALALQPVPTGHV
jgi:hypothetical protein